MAIRILIVDDHQIVREGLRMFLARDPDLCVVEEAANGIEAIEKARLVRPDVVLMDVILPGIDGITATATIRQELPQTEVLALTNLLEGPAVARAIRAGAIGYLLKDARATELRSAIKAAAMGQVQLSPQVEVYLLQEMQNLSYLDLLSGQKTEMYRDDLYNNVHGAGSI